MYYYVLYVSDLVEEFKNFRENHDNSFGIIWNGCDSDVFIKLSQQHNSQIVKHYQFRREPLLREYHDIQTRISKVIWNSEEKVNIWWVTKKFTLSILELGQDIIYSYWEKDTITTPDFIDGNTLDIFTDIRIPTWE